MSNKRDNKKPKFRFHLIGYNEHRVNTYFGLSYRTEVIGWLDQVNVSVVAFSKEEAISKATKSVGKREQWSLSSMDEEL